MVIISRPSLSCNKTERIVLEEFYNTIKDYCNKCEDCTNCPLYNLCNDKNNEFFGGDLNAPDVLFYIFNCLGLF